MRKYKLALKDLIIDKDYIYGRNLEENIPKLRLGNLDAYRDWGYAGDYVEAMWMMLQQEIPDDYVICTGKTYTIKDFLDRAFGYINVDNWSNFVVVDQQFYRPAEVDYLCGNNTKATTKLGWKPKYDLDMLVSLMIDSDLHDKLSNYVGHI
jgi:GDPmannose 4,6-dehydratase